VSDTTISSKEQMLVTYNHFKKIKTMYNKVECITLSCDNCGEIYIDENGTGFSIWGTESDAHEHADNDGWHLDDKHYCPTCHTIDDDDNLVINPVKTYKQ
jgi:rubredoxin